MVSEHTNTGNCWAKKCRRDGCKPGSLCDVCHEHHEPRGECDLCGDCKACEEANEDG